MKPIILLTSLAIVLTACQSTPTAPVMARADQSFETTGLGKTKTDAQKDALNSAKKQCGLKTPIIIKDEWHYQGILDEKTDRLISKGASVIGAVIGSKVPSLASDDDYEYKISFKCQ